MPEWSTIGLFAAAAAALVVVPGPNTIYIATRSIEMGPKAGVVSCLRVMVGTMVHVAVAAAGLAALMLSSVAAFNLVKYAGAAYLVFLGVRALLSVQREAPWGEAVPGGSLWATFRQGVAVNVLNPKTALFIGALLPQFVDPTLGSVALQTLVLGAVLMLVGGASDATYALLAGGFGGWLRGSRKYRNAQRYVAGGVYIRLGVAAALLGPKGE